MEAFERIKVLRKEKLKITQEEFSKAINISRGNLAAIETGRVQLTDRNIKIISTTYNVSEAWLRDGIEPIFRERSTNEELAAFFGDTLANEDDYFKKQFITGLAKLEDEDWKVLEMVIDKIISKRTKK